MNIKSTSRTLLLSAVAVILVLSLMTAGRVHADDPDDGRINFVPWVNSWGAVAVYCVDADNVPAANFSTGGIKILNDHGQQVYKALNAEIEAAQKLSVATGKPALVKAQGLYSIYAIGDKKLALYSKPDAEGKTFLASWQSCTPVHSPDGKSPTQELTQEPTVVVVGPCEGPVPSPACE